MPIQVPFEQMTAPLLKKFSPIHRFLPVQNVILDRNHHLNPHFSSSSITVLSWNIAKNNHVENWVADFQHIRAQYAPDLVFLQEVRIGAEAPHTPGLDDFNWTYAPNFFDAHHATYSGILTGATAYAMQRRSLTTRSAEPITNTPKISLLTQYHLPGRNDTLLAVNAHLINFVDLNSFKAELAVLERAIACHTGAIILAGDFNTWNQSRWGLLKQMTERLQLLPAAFSLSESKKIKRFLLSPPLDYIFYRGLTENLSSVRVLEQVSSSDHKPILVEFFP